MNQNKPMHIHPGTFSVITFGCKANQFDSASIVSQLCKTGLSFTENPEAADVIIINTCTVTAKTDYKCRQAVRKWKNRFQGRKIIVTGCYAERDAPELSCLKEIDLFLGNSSKNDFVEAIRPCLNLDVRKVNPDKTIQSFEFPSEFPGMTRALVKIQDGCDEKCAYCIVPYVRGKGRSLPASTVAEQVLMLEKKGFREAIITGIHIGKWGADLNPKQNLLSLLQLLTEKLDIKLRLSSLEPNEITLELVDFISRNSQIRPHFHIPLQSGSTNILKSMNRRYSIDEYESVIRLIEKSFDFPAIGTDIIVGFPGETDEDFNMTCSLVNRLPFSYLHIFPFSARPGTSAASLKNKIPEKVITERARHLRGIGLKKKEQFIKSQIGTHREAVTLTKKTGDDTTSAISDNYIPVKISDKKPANTIVRVEFRSVLKSGAAAVIIDNP